MRAFIKFNRGVMKMPMLVRLWLMLLVALNLVVPLFSLDRLEAQVVVVTFVASVMLMTVLTASLGFNPLMGLGHIFWIPLMYFLWLRLDQIPVDEPFGLWIRALMVANAISLVIDTIDVTRYISGERNETVQF